MSGRWKKWVAGHLVVIGVVALVMIVIFAFGFADKWIRLLIINQAYERTGARVEMRAFHFNPWSLTIDINDLTVHGLEGPGAAPLFHADQVEVGFRILSFFRRQIALDRLTVDRPEVTVTIDRYGRSNVPAPEHRGPSRPWRSTLFSLRIGQLALRDGGVIYNNQRTPLAVDGQNFEFTLHYDAPANAPDSYVGNFQWQQVRLALRHDVPFRFDVSTKFTLQRDSFELQELVLNLPHSQFNLRASLASFARPDWDFRYRGRLSLDDVRTIFRKPTAPQGTADFSGSAHYASNVDSTGAQLKPGDWTATGYFDAHDIRMGFEWFHDSGLETSGNYDVTKQRLVVNNLSARAFGASLDGNLQLDFKGLAFRTDTHLHGASLAQTFAALDHDGFPVDSLHWDSLMTIDSVNTWDGAFKDFRTRGAMRWNPAATPPPGTIPVAAQFQFDYDNDKKIVVITQSQITTPKGEVDVDGTLGKTDSALETQFRTSDLTGWDDFINAIRGRHAEPKKIAGSVEWTGRVLGPIVGPTFSGHMDAKNTQYGDLQWDTLKGDFDYSPDGFHLTNATVQRGQSLATMDISLQFDGDWSFTDASPWTMHAKMNHADSSDLQEILGTNYRVTGTLSGDLRGSGTRASPVFDASFVFDDMGVMGFTFDSLSGEFHWEEGEISLSQAVLHENSTAIAGDISYWPKELRTEFDLNGTGISLEKIPKLQTASLPIGGQLGFHLRGGGPLFTPSGQGDVTLTDLRLGSEIEGNFSGRLSSDGQTASITLASAAPALAKVDGQLSVGLTGEHTITGRLSATQFDLDPLIAAGLHLGQLTGHSSADGVFTISGALSQPDSIEVNADIARISFDYQLVQLTNDQDIKLTYRRNEVRVDQAHLHGPDTDFRFSGSARFDRDRPLRLALSGNVNLRLVKGLLPDLDAHGSTAVNVSVEGTIARPVITGRATVQNVSAVYGDFPVGLSKLSGEFLFDKSRLVFDHVTAEAGGGQLTLSGNLAYGEGPVRYEITAATPQARIRYPSGMSWLASGTLQLTGTSTAGVLSGNVQVQRILFSQGVDVASFFAAASETSPGPPSTSPFLQNLALDVHGQTGPGARIEWSGAHVDIDGDVRLRGTFDRPVLLGNVHLLGGEMPFRGNKFEITRGDINFANPFRLDPELDVEATSTISQYQVTIDFSGKASHLALNYRSDPPLPDTDIVALLALGSPGSESGLRSSAGSENYGATALLSEAISTGVGSRIEHLFGISSFRVDPFVAETSTESNAAARVTIQEQVARGLTVTYSSNAATSNQYQLIQVEYAIKRDL
ncbi:MAG TPA: translocation/assembly module TamB domain-containing protein, partial [Candidatus Baltobacteraceae bacterium]|nr:translocation/assembly module TamB domain-containing protein [Candidatus Baltobacteraceae bacterium]